MMFMMLRSFRFLQGLQLSHTVPRPAELVHALLTWLLLREVALMVLRVGLKGCWFEG
jgi:hypothetical protein